MNTRMSATMSTSGPPLDPIKDNPAVEPHFAVPKLPHDPHESLHVPRPSHSPSSLGLAFHGMAMGGLGAPEGVGHALSDTPIASTPSTAPSSPRM